MTAQATKSTIPRRVVVVAPLVPTTKTNRQGRHGLLLLVACVLVASSFAASLVYSVWYLDQHLLLSQQQASTTSHHHHQRGAHAPPKIPPATAVPGVLSCEAYGGPWTDLATTQEMVYWQTIPSDARVTSPYERTPSVPSKSQSQPTQTLFLTFEQDDGGWNNIRMAMETVLAMARATGRTLVLPPRQEMYLLYDETAANQTTTKTTKKQQQQQRTDFDFADFFPLEEMKMSQSPDGGAAPAAIIVSMQEFLETQGLSGQLRDKRTGAVTFPPHNRTNWDGDTLGVTTELQRWLRTIAVVPDWNPEECVAVFPDPSLEQEMETDSPTIATTTSLIELQFLGLQRVSVGGLPPWTHFVGRPTPVNGSALDRLMEIRNERERLCVYNPTLRHEAVLHFPGKQPPPNQRRQQQRIGMGGRLLVHFYAFLFFEDWRRDVWTKRLIRDKVRYRDEIQCAAARVIEAVRERSRQRGHEQEGAYAAFHVRRGEFQYKRTLVSSAEMYNQSRDLIPDGATVYIATDEKNHEFFQSMIDHYDVVFLSDYVPLLDGINTNFYGMIDQLVASKSHVFFGCWFSTFTAYINRLRGYHADRLHTPGFDQGIIHSYYYALADKKMRMQEYWPISGAVYAREFPTSWRQIDQGIDAL